LGGRDKIGNGDGGVRAGERGDNLFGAVGGDIGIDFGGRPAVDEDLASGDVHDPVFSNARAGVKAGFGRAVETECRVGDFYDQRRRIRRASSVYG